MAVYKVIQNVEAEDKLLGPFGLKQFVYIIIAGFSAFICFRVATLTALGPMRWSIVLLFLIPVLIFGLLAAPLGGSQPTETWLLARLRFILKPQKRIWDQSGAKELVTITAPKTIAKQYSDGLSQNEVKSRLNALATTLDSRGWAIKNASVNMYAPPGYLADDEQSDRLVTTQNLPQDVPAVDVRPEDDILDPDSNITAHHLDRLMNEASEKVRMSAVEKFNAMRTPQAPANNAAPAPDFWFMHQSAHPQAPANPNEVMFSNPAVAIPGVKTEQTLSAVINSLDISPSQETAMLAALETKNRRRQIGEANLPKLNTPAQARAKKLAAKTHTAERETAIISLASRDDISVATVAKEAKRQTAPKPIAEQNNDGEIVVHLH